MDSEDVLRFPQKHCRGNGGPESLVTFSTTALCAALLQPEHVEKDEVCGNIAINSSLATKTSPDTKHTTQGAVMDERLFYKCIQRQVHFTDKKVPAHNNTTLRL